MNPIFEEKPVSNKLNRYGLYDMQELTFKEQEIKQSYTKIVRPLLAFAPFIHEEATFENFNITYRPDDSNLFVEDELTYEGNLTTINELVKEEPESLDEFVEMIRSRLRVKNLQNVTAKDQEDLIRISVQEAKFKWKEMKRIIEDPTLSEEDNVELRRRVFVNVISICEKLFNHYIEKADTLKSREIFSDSANFSRLKTLMAHDCHKFLNVHSLKHYLSADMKRYKRIEDGIEQYKERKPNEVLKLRRITIRDLVEDFRLKYKIRTRRYKNSREHLKEIYESMPILETKKLQNILKTATKRKNELDLEVNLEKMDTSEVSDHSVLVTERKSNSPESEMSLIEKLATSKNMFTLKRRSKSMIRFNEQTLAEELNINRKRVMRDRYKTTDSIIMSVIINKKTDNETENNVNKIDLNFLSRQNEKAVAQTLKQDLENLTWAVQRKEALKYEQDDEALIMTLMSKPDHKKRMKEIKKKIRAIDKRQKAFLEEIKLPLIDQKEHPQPATFETKFYNNYPIRLSDIRVSTRILRFNITIKEFGPLYNDVSGEIDSDMVLHLDRNLYIGGEVKEVYDELVKTISEDHLRFDLDDYVQKAPSKLTYESGYTSSVLMRNGRTKSMNSEILSKSKQIAPWSDRKMEFREWNRTLSRASLDRVSRERLVSREAVSKASYAINEVESEDDYLEEKPLIEPEPEEKSRKSKSFRIKQPIPIKPIEIKPEKIEQFRNGDPAELNNKEFKHWLNWWQNTYSTEDYLKFLSTQSSDYLGLMFHLYDEKSSSSFIQTDEEIKLLHAKKLAEKEREEIIVDLKNKKYNYEPGVWNPDSILLGGLGKDPEPDAEDDPIVKLKTELEKSKPKSKKMQFFKSNVEDNKEEEEARAKMLAMLQEKKKDSPQQRLERVWNLLRMNDTAKLDMAIKYCSNSYADKLMQAIEDWEKATDLIVERERCIYELENFERVASDPNRFFAKGFKGSSAARLDEALKRDNLYKSIDKVQAKIEALLLTIEKKYKDTITYNGRGYLDKMKWDRIEMLHWLTEERRMKYFKNEIRSKQLNASVIKLAS